jgi:hypothetical protein
MNLRHLAFAAILAIAGQPTPEDAATPETVYRGAIAKADKEHAAALATATSDYVRGLKEALTTQMKKGNLDAALAIRDRLKAVEGESGGSPLDKLAGTRWVANKGATFEWRPDGTFLHKGGVRPCVVVDANRVIIFFEHKRVDVLEFDKGFTKFDHWVLSSPPAAVESGHREGK